MKRIAAALAIALAAVAVFGCTRPATPASQPPQSSAPAIVETPAPETPSAEQTPSEPSKPATVAPKPKPKPQDTEAEMKSAAGAAALKAAKANASASVGSLSIERVKVARDATGKWWGLVLVKPSNPGVDELTVLLERTSAGWKAFDLGTGIGSEDERFPADVRGKLG